VAEADLIILCEADKDSDPHEDDVVPEVSESLPVTRPGDVWQMGHHRLICGDARDPAAYAALLGTEKVALGFHDFPYNVKIKGHVSGLGRIVHDEFAFASGEMADEEFIAFLTAALSLAASHSKEGAIHYGCMDDLHAFELLSAARRAGLLHKTTCVWAKTNGGMGSLYRKQCEFVHVLKVGTAPHVNNVELGRHGRNRTTLWSYAGVNTFRKGRMSVAVTRLLPLIDTPEGLVEFDSTSHALAVTVLLASRETDFDAVGSRVTTQSFRFP
jgi:hypothetical protein